MLITIVNLIKPKWQAARFVQRPERCATSRIAASEESLTRAKKNIMNLQNMRKRHSKMSHRNAQNNVPNWRKQSYARNNVRWLLCVENSRSCVCGLIGTIVERTEMWRWTCFSDRTIATGPKSDNNVCTPYSVVRSRTVNRLTKHAHPVFVTVEALAGHLAVSFYCMRTKTVYTLWSIRFSSRVSSAAAVVRWAMPNGHTISLLCLLVLWYLIGHLMGWTKKSTLWILVCAPVSGSLLYSYRS